MPYNSVSKIALDICSATGATPRQMDYWARCGVFGDEFIALGSGARRPWWKPLITEAVDICAQLSEFGAHTTVLAMAANAVMTRPVVEGEWLVVTEDGATRHSHVCFDQHQARTPAYVIPLRSFADVGLAVDVAPAAGSPVGPVATISSS